MDQNRADNIPPFTGNSIATTKRTEFCPCIKAVVLQVVLYGNVTPHLNARYKADVLPALLYSAPSNITVSALLSSSSDSLGASNSLSEFM